MAEENMANLPVEKSMIATEMASDALVTLQNPSYVVGIGASAGGLAALRAFFSRVEPSEDVAYVVVQHLSPDFKSLMGEILAQHTVLPISTIRDGLEMRAGHIYLIPPGHNLATAGSTLQLRRGRGRDGRPSFPIDDFFESLADSHGERAIAIVLSGTGTDGSRGVRAVYAAGGTVLVQSPETAEFDGMLRAAMATRCVDKVLGPTELAQAVRARVALKLDGPDLHGQTLNESHTDLVNRILQLIAAEHDVDFSMYKEGTVQRRLVRRCAISHDGDLNVFLERLQASKAERRILVEDLLVGVTRFFRDIEPWEMLKHQILPALVDQLPAGQPLRVWVSGCSTGEEAYSVAMIMDEVRRNSGAKLSIDIFATDANASALAFASTGTYPESIAADVSSERLERYFVRHGSTFRVTKSLRRMLIFAQHNLIKDPPFNRIHLATCRNLLIYLNSRAQRVALSRLHFALDSGGVLVLGAAEAPGNILPSIHVIDRRWKLFRKSGDTPVVSQPWPYRGEGRLFTEDPKRKAAGNSLREGLLETAWDGDLKRRGAVVLLCNSDGEILHSLGDTGRFLRVPTGRTTRLVTELVIPELKLAVGTSLHVARQGNAAEGAVTYRKVIGEGESPTVMGVRVTPFTRVPQGDECFQVLMEPVAEDTTANVHASLDPSEATVRRIADLEAELADSRSILQATIQELEGTNADQQSTNEELYAANEELQTTNEELQSVNEELYTVNAEYQNKIRELIEVNSDLDNLLQSIDVGVLFLDNELCIRRFTNTTLRFVNLTAFDVGRPLGHFTHRIKRLDLIAFTREVLRSGAPGRAEVEDLEGHSLLIRAMPYRTADDRDPGVVLTVVDITEIKQAALALIESEDRFLQVVTNMGDAFWLMSLDGKKMLYVSPAYENLWGRSVEALGVEPFDWTHGLSESDREYVLTRLKAVAEGVSMDEEYELTRPDGSAIWVRHRASPVMGDNGVVRHIAVIVEDITARRRVADLQALSQDRLRRVIDLVPHQIFATDLQGRFVFANEATSKALGSSPAKLVGMLAPTAFALPDGGVAMREEIRKVIECQERFDSVEERRIRSDGTEQILETSRVPLASATGEGRLALAISVDVTQKRSSEEALRHRAFYDQLTGLPNRTLFSERLSHHMQGLRRDGAGQLAILFLDLDGFKDVNDTLGHLRGDDLLVQVAGRLQRCVRPGDTIARFGGDEFAVLLEAPTSEMVALQVANRIHDYMREPFELDDHRVFSSSSVGVAICNSPDAGVSNLMVNADVAMYAAKHKGPACTAVFTESMRKRTERLSEVKFDLRDAVERAEFVPWFQPIVDLATGRVSGLEALVRWNHPVRGQIQPNEFVTVAERMGLIRQIERQLLKQIAALIAEWIDGGAKGLDSISVNVAAGHLAEADFADYVLGVLAEAGLSPHRLVLELTETTFIDQSMGASRAIQQLKEAGVRLALDDFGTGYSSMTHLCRFPIDILKVDRSFVSQVHTRIELAHIVNATIGLGRSLGVKVTAEGIETPEQLAFLRERGCDGGQGYFFSPPMDSEQTWAFLAATAVSPTVNGFDPKAIVKPPVN